MNRRNFLFNSGLSFAGLIISARSYGGFHDEKTTFLPNEIWANINGQMLPLKSVDKLKWTNKKIEVLLKRNSGLIEIYISSTLQPISAVILKWKNTIKQNDKLLCDHWERTYGDVGWQSFTPNKKMPWYFLQFDGKNTNGFGVKTGANTICDWQINDGLQLTLDTRSGGMGVQLGKRILHAADIISIQNKMGETPFATGQRFCKMMCDKPRLPKMPVYGINDWYFAYGKNSSELILEHTALLADLVTDTNNLPFSVIDAGWASYSPLLPDDCCWQDDFSKPNKNFKDMAKLADDVKKLGMRPGLWTRPLCAAYNDKASLLLPSIPGRNNPKNPILDPTIPENIERVIHNITTYNRWGFEMVKHDFTTFDMLGKWGFEMPEDITTSGWRFNDNSKTTAEIILHLYKSIREAAGEMYLIGCNTISHLSAGIFELNRIGDDTSGNEWTRTRKMGVNTLAFRGIQHNHFYATDADCVGLTDKVPWAKNKQWMKLLAESGTPLFISAQPNAVGAEQKAFIKKCFTSAAKIQPVGQAVDWMDSTTPSKWKLNGKIVDFDWS